VREKAREFFEEARILAGAKRFNGAASRLYYALYHLIIAIFEEKGVKQAQLTNKVDAENPGYWLHEVVRNNSTLAGVARRDAWVIKDLWLMRVKADYKDKSVSESELLELIDNVELIFEQLNA
jgi:hypothetical protein